MPFGFCNSPATFLRFINVVFRDLANKGIVIMFFDDIIIPASNEEQGLQRLRLVLETAVEYGLDINWKKCRFMLRKIEFLGYVIEDGRIHPSPDKTTAVQNFPEPKSCKDVQSFLGLAGYFRRFIPQFSVVAKTLSDLLKKEAVFKFNIEERTAFEALKKSLIEEPVLKIYHPDH